MIQIHHRFYAASQILQIVMYLNSRQPIILNNLTALIWKGRSPYHQMYPPLMISLNTCLKRNWRKFQIKMHSFSILLISDNNLRAYPKLNAICWGRSYLASKWRLIHSGRLGTETFFPFKCAVSCNRSDFVLISASMPSVNWYNSVCVDNDVTK